jgi:hypothetical protein
MRVFAKDTARQLISMCFADDHGADIEQLLHDWRRPSRRFMRSMPVRIAATRDMAGDVK